MALNPDSQRLVHRIEAQLLRTVQEHGAFAEIAITLVGLRMAQGIDWPKREPLQAPQKPSGGVSTP